MVPHTKAETEIYKPPTLANLADPPTFKFRPATFRDKRAFSRATMVEDLKVHSTDALRQALRSELSRLWSPEERDAQLARLEAYWAASDQNRDAGPDNQVIIDPEEAIAYSDLMAAVLGASQLLRSMMADNSDFYAFAPKVALGQFLVGWTGLETPFRREGGVVSIETLTDVEEELSRIEVKAKADNIEGIGQIGTAFDLLAAHALTLLGLTGAEESKSASPSPSSSNQEPLMTASTPLPAGGKSQGGRPSKKTPSA
jgi:hypothetical protein